MFNTQGIRQGQLIRNERARIGRYIAETQPDLYQQLLSTLIETSRNSEALRSELRVKMCAAAGFAVGNILYTRPPQKFFLTIPIITKMTDFYAANLDAFNKAFEGRVRNPSSGYNRLKILNLVFGNVVRFRKACNGNRYEKRVAIYYVEPLTEQLIDAN